MCSGDAGVDGALLPTATSFGARAEPIAGAVVSLAGKVKVLRDVVHAGAYSVVKHEAQKMPGGEQSLLVGAHLH